MEPGGDFRPLQTMLPCHCVKTNNPQESLFHELVRHDSRDSVSWVGGSHGSLDVDPPHKQIAHLWEGSMENPKVSAIDVGRPRQMAMCKLWLPSAGDPPKHRLFFEATLSG